jgi:hypothetical protein
MTISRCDGQGEVLATVIDFLNDLPGAAGVSGERWREGIPLRVVRREPYATHASNTVKGKQERAVHGDL